MSEKLAKIQAIEFAMIRGIERAEREHYKKPYDIALFIRTELDRAGLKIVWRPGQKP